MLGRENRITLNTRGSLGIALIAQGKFPEATTEYSETLKSMERVLGFEHPDISEYAAKIEDALVRQNKNWQAMQVATEVEEGANESLGPDNPATQNYIKLRRDLEARSDVARPR